MMKMEMSVHWGFTVLMGLVFHTLAHLEHLEIKRYWILWMPVPCAFLECIALISI